MFRLAEFVSDGSAVTLSVLSSGHYQLYAPTVVSQGIGLARKLLGSAELHPSTCMSHAI